MKLKLFVWEGVLRDYTSGMVCILAKDLSQAFELLYQKDDIAWSQLQGIWDSMSWEHNEVMAVHSVNPSLNLTQIQKIILDKKGIKVSPTHIPPLIVSEPNAFIVHGGG